MSVVILCRYSLLRLPKPVPQPDVTLAIDRGYTAPSLNSGADLALGKTGCLVMKITVVLLLLCVGLGACGQKGPLYLPQPVKPKSEVVEPKTPQQDLPVPHNSEPAPTTADPA